MISNRLEMEPTPEGRLAIVVREELYRHLGIGRKYPPDFADLREVLKGPVHLEILSERLAEAQLKPNNDERVFQLLLEIADFFSRYRTMKGG